MNKTHLTPQVEWKEICSGSIPPVDPGERLGKKVFLGAQRGAESEQKIDES